MCGIFGIWHFDGKPIDLPVVRRATTTLGHRGPDDEGYLLVNTQTGRVVSCGGRDTDPRVLLPPIDQFFGEDFDLVLGFRRLAILDLSPAGHQPMASADGSFWIIFNGEIYNYLELRAELSGNGYEFQTATDAEVILAAYEPWGHECLRRFNGMWALALWDRRDGRLFIARDRFGIKPLYYTEDGRRVVFASEIKALIGSHGASFEPDQEAIYRYLVAGFLPSAQTGKTFFRNVHSLPPGHWLTIYEGAVRAHPYWMLNLTTKDAVEMTSTAPVEQYRGLFIDAVRLRLRADVPVGTCLSGGIDSSSIVCVINRLIAERGATERRLGKQQRTFSAVYDIAGPYDEREHIEKVLEASGAKGHFTFPTGERLRTEMERLVWHQDEPFISTSIFAQWCVMDEARQRGVKVLLDGQGADELLAGYRPFRIFLGELVRQAGVAGAMAEARAIRAQTGIAAWPLLGLALMQQLPHQWQDALRRRWDRRRTDWSVFNPDFVAQWNKETIADWRPSYEHQKLDTHLRNLLQESGLPHLLRYEDRNSMAFGVEARLPYLDYRLVELSFREAAPWRIHHGWTKWILRKAMESFVPDEIIWRKDKIGFETPETAWLVQWLRAEPDLFEDDSPSGAYLDLQTVRDRVALWTECNGRGPRLPLWRWINLDAWLRVWQLAWRAEV